ncbi:MAG: tetratricopeptide repeat protein [Burkholderiaceae bacterium]|nr:tetratricopeptide repeat protein [Burkholderiaceae bacterium]
MAVLLGVLCCAPACAQQPPAAISEADLLYEQALQSIAEGRKNDANATLQRVIDMAPSHAGAWLELALLQCSLGNQAEAERLFSVIELRFDPPPGIVQLMANTRTTGCVSAQPVGQYSITVSRGIDQNVNQGSTRDLGLADLGLSPEFRPRHDQYTMLSGEYLRDLSANGALGFVQFQGRHNDSLHQYDSGALFAGAETPWRLSEWSVRGTALAGFITLGGKLYQRQYQLQARVGPPMALPYSLQFHLLGGLTHASYATLQNFDSTTGELRGLLSRRNGNTSINASLGVQRDNATDARPGGNRRGWSASLQWRHRYGSNITTDLGYNMQAWNSSLPYAPKVIEQVRDQSTHVLRATVIYPVTRNQSLVLEARQVINRENIPIFQYNNRQLQLSWQWQGP